MSEKRDEIAVNTLALERSPQRLFKQIFKSDFPEQFVRQIPSQNLYLAIRAQGLPSSSEVIELLNREQFQVVLDFDLWERDRFNEDKLWEWLELPDTADDLKPLQQLLVSVDLKLIALLLSRHIEVIINEEATDSAPGVGFSSPDKGFTWVKVTTEDSHRAFLLKRLLALIFETKAELYYQLLSIPNVSTESTLEEEAYQDKTKRVQSEGVPDDDWAAKLNSPLPLKSAATKLTTEERETLTTDIDIIPTFFQNQESLKPLQSFYDAISDKESLEQEITLVMNSALVFFRISAWEISEVNFLLEQVRGATNIGLERILDTSPSTSFEKVFEILGFKGVYQVGLESIFPIRSRAQKIDDEACQNEPMMLHVVEGLASPFPKLAAFVNEDGTFQAKDEKLEGGYRALETLTDVHLSEVVLSKLEG